MWIKLPLVIAAASVLLVSVASRAGADPASDAAAKVSSLLESRVRGCPHVAVLSVMARATTPEEVTDTRPAGYDVSATVTNGGGVTAEFLVSSGQVYPDNSLAGALATGCRRDPPAPDGALEWHGLPYMDPSGGVIHIGSDGPWHGAQPNHRLPSFVAPIPEGDGTPVWTKVCARGTQTAHFRRTFYLLGRPDSLLVAISGVNAGGRNPLTSATVLFNGHRVLTGSRPAGLTTLTARLRKASLRSLRFGANHIDVLVDKTATGRCNGRSRHQIGVRFTFNGSFHSDTGGASLEIQSASLLCATECGGSFVLPFKFRVNGPSALLEPRFTLDVHFAEADQLVPPVSAQEGGIGDGHCHESQLDRRTVELVCSWPPFLAGTVGRLTFSIVYGVKVRPPFKEIFTVRWHLPGQSSVSGPMAHNAAGSRRVTVCFPRGPDCAAPVS